MDVAIETHHLTKRFKTVTAVEDLNLRVPSGSLFGFIGPNGAGKTTTLRMLAGLLDPTQGEILLNGVNVTQTPEAARALIGYMPDFFGVYEDMKVWEYLDFFARCYGLPPRRRRQVVDELLDLVDLAHKREDFVEHLSRGMRQRLCLAHALVHDPPILLLDEPASGLDPRARVEMRELLKELGRMNKTVVISSHILSELAELCDTVGIIERGRLVTAGPMREIAAQIAGARLLRVGLLHPEETRAAALAALQGHPQIGELFEVDEGVEFTFTGEDATRVEILRHLVQQGIPVISFVEVTTDLEEIFLRLTKGEVQ